MIRIFSQYVSIKSVSLMLLESFLMALSMICALRLRFWNHPTEVEVYAGFPGFLFQAALVVVTCQICFYYNGLYDLSAVRHKVDQFIRIGESIGAACLLLGLLYFLAPGLLIGHGVFLVAIALGVSLIGLARGLLNKVWHAATTSQKILIIGSGELAMNLARELTQRGDLNTTLVGFKSWQSTEGTLLGHPVWGDQIDLESLVADHKISRIVVAMEDCRGRLPVKDLVKLRVSGIRVEDVQTVLASLTGRVYLNAVLPSWLVFSDGFRRSSLTIAVKRAIDLAFGMVGFLLSAPIMFVVALAIRLDSKGPIIYRQVRVGWKGHRFEILKFRSMREDAERASGAQWAVEADPRVTRVGRFLRKYRLDELPQFINVIRGDMSFVGPRPERPVFVNQLREAIIYYDERHSVRPGITGWAQVKYRYGATTEDSFRKLEYDLFYLKHMSIAFDCAIIFETVRVVLLGFGSR
jgi:sugar transferase (PEP-CTERM system associated)